MSYSWSLCHLLYAGAPGWRLWLAVFPVLPVPGTACPLHNAISSTLHHSPHLLLFVFVAAMWVHLPAQPPSHPALHVTITQVVLATSELSICTAATVNSCFIVWLPLVACFQLHSQGWGLFYLFFLYIHFEKIYFHIGLPFIFVFERHKHNRKQTYHKRLIPNVINKLSYFDRL